MKLPETQALLRLVNRQTKRQHLKAGRNSLLQLNLQELLSMKLPETQALLRLVNRQTKDKEQE